jgi:hypothetical protein
MYDYSCRLKDPPYAQIVAPALLVVDSW